MLLTLKIKHFSFMNFFLIGFSLYFNLENKISKNHYKTIIISSISNIITSFPFDVVVNMLTTHQL